jgi:hypothetical protein
MIYFTQDRNNHNIKIGYAADPAQRRTVLQVGNSSRLEILLAIEGEKADEGALHQRFAAANVNGEWFEPVPELLAFMLEQQAAVATWNAVINAAPTVHDEPEDLDDPRRIFGHGCCGQNDWLLLCPVCGFDYTHTEAAFTRVGSDECEAGIYVDTKPRGTTEARRSALVCVFDGECGHRWELVIQQHKGNNFIEINVLETMSLPDHPDSDQVAIRQMQITVDAEAERLAAQQRLLALQRVRLQNRIHQMASSRNGETDHDLP